jgi:leucyl/phenylalanyl-tRNA--protein transferase
MPGAMPVYRLIDEPVFPPVSHADRSGLLAVGGDLSPSRLLSAYRCGIFPWYSDGEPILWFSPDPRMVLPTDQLRLGRGTKRTLRRARYELRLDTAFDKVIRACARTPRPEQSGTWLTLDMVDAYCRLHELGFAHSAEAWEDGQLVGGVYGVSLGGYFCGESMFRTRDGASLAALVALVLQLRRWGIGLFDCQMYSRHTERLGAREWPRERFLQKLSGALDQPTRAGRWRFDADYGPDLARDLYL